MADNTALIQVLGAIAYGELKAYDGAKAEAESAATEDARRWHRQVAAEELRHHKGFVKRLEALGADPERAMAPYRGPLDRYHAYVSDDPIEDAVFGYLGEGIADDLLQWLQKVADPETVAFADTVIADEVGHEAAATKVLRELLDVTPNGRARAARAARVMHGHMLWSGRTGAAPLTAFVRLGHTPELLRVIIGGQARRLRAIGIRLWLPMPDRIGPLKLAG
jgi:rubrerythrin